MLQSGFNSPQLGRIYRAKITMTQVKTYTSRKSTDVDIQAKYPPMRLILASKLTKKNAKEFFACMLHFAYLGETATFIHARLATQSVSMHDSA